MKPKSIVLLGGEVVSGQPLHILREGSVYDMASGELICKITEELMDEVVKGHTALSRSQEVPIDFEHGLRRGKTPEERQTYGLIVSMDRSDEGVFGTPLYNELGVNLVDKNDGGALKTSPVLHFGPLFDPKTGEELSKAWVEMVSLTTLPRQSDLQPVALGRMNDGGILGTQLAIDPGESVNEARKRLFDGAKDKLRDSPYGEGGYHFWLEDWSLEHVIIEVFSHIKESAFLIRMSVEEDSEGRLNFGAPERVRRKLTYETEPEPIKPHIKGLGRDTVGDITLPRAEHEAMVAELARLRSEKQEAAQVATEQEGTLAELGRTIAGQKEKLARLEAAELARAEADRRAKVETLLSRALREGKITAASTEGWRKDLLGSPEVAAATERSLGRLQAGAVAPTELRGFNGPGEPTTEGKISADDILSLAREEGLTYHEAETRLKALRGGAK